MKYPICQILILSLVLIGCTVKNPAKDESVDPVISNLVLADTLLLNSGTGYPVSVHVIDPQGWSDIQKVACIVSSGKILFEQTLKDDGQFGDIIPHDDVFWGLLAGSSFSSTVEKTVIAVAAEDAEGNTSDTLYQSVVLIAGAPDQPPALSNPKVPGTVRSDSLVSLFFSVQVSDARGLQDIRSVYFDVYPPFATSSMFRITLKDDGTLGDALPNDGIFSLRGNFGDILKTIGLHQVRFEAQDKAGKTSGPLVKQFTVIGVNGPPVLSQLTAPPSVSRQSPLPTLMTIRADDPQGLQDIKRVYFNTTKPDGSPSSGNPFLMHDDGRSGDKTAGDGVYSLNIFITPQNALGDYRFEFFAEDVSGTVSSSIVHTITVDDGT